MADDVNANVERRELWDELQRMRERVKALAAALLPFTRPGCTSWAHFSYDDVCKARALLEGKG